MGGENWETRLGRSRAGLLRSPRDLHFVFATFGARPSLRNFDALLVVNGIEPQGSMPDVDVGFRPLSGFDVARCLDVYVT